MPSLRPRSAIRSRSLGNVRRRASRMAQPARTRSARSGPMQPWPTRAANGIALTSAIGAIDVGIRHPQPVDPAPVVAREAEEHARHRGDGAGGAEEVEAGAPPLRPGQRREGRQGSLDIGHHGVETRRRHRLAAETIRQRHDPERQRRPGPDPLPHAGLPLGGDAPPEPHDFGRAATDVEEQHAFGFVVGQSRASFGREAGFRLAIDDLHVEARSLPDAVEKGGAVFGGPGRPRSRSGRERVTPRAAILSWQTSSAAKVRSIARSPRRPVATRFSPSRTMREKASTIRSPSSPARAISRRQLLVPRSRAA